MLSSFLQDRIGTAKKLVDELSREFEYAAVFGRHAIGKRYIKTSKQTLVADSSQITDSDAGFVVKVYNNGHYSEYSCDDIKNLKAADVKKAVNLNGFNGEKVDVAIIREEKMTQSFCREDEEKLDDETIIAGLETIVDKAMSQNAKIVETQAAFIKREISNIFVSNNKTLDQYYTYNNVMAVVIANDGDNIQQSYDVTYGVNSKTCLDEMQAKIEEIATLAVRLLEAKPIEPGVYDVITHPSISGLIAHEAFGHGVEMDMFVKNRAKAKDFIGKDVASPLVNMHDGAAAALSSASYFFDDDGVLAQDTQIIKDGILLKGISDLLSALELKSDPTGNSRRESSRAKAYTRMTNTFFDKGKDKLEDMIGSIQHGYYLCQTSNGMEDPKNWQIQCTAQYAYEIIDGKLTDNIYAPVVMSGYVLDLLHSISMVSDEVIITGSGMCGKGHKEWVYVADGGPYLKARVKLG